MSKKWSFVLLFVLLASTFLTACGPPQTIEKVVTQVVPGATGGVVKETVVQVEKETAVPPTPVPVDRKGAWVDQIVIVEEPNTAAGITRLESGELDVYAYAIADRELYKRVRESADLSYSLSYGSYNELTFNPAGPVFSGTQALNPFAVPAIREAMNYLIDRDYIVQDIFGGLAVPRYLAITPAFPDYAKMADIARVLELKYAYNPDKAKEIITAEMEKLGATLEGGKWMYNGQPVTLIFLIRIEDERKAIGDYVANQLEGLGFTVDRQYKKSAEASPIWNRSDPNEGLWHIYTGGWVTTAISRDDGSNFGYFYTPRGSGSPLWQNYKNTPEFDAVCEKLWNNDFKDLAERTSLFKEALDLSMQDSVRVWLVNRVSFSPQRSNIQIAADLAGSVYGAALFAQTVRRTGEVGGALTVAMPALMNDPWNPIAGSNFIYDNLPIRATADTATKPDPYTGLFWPQRAEKAEIVVQEGLPVGKTLDWIDLSFAPSIEVPGDAWADWDAVNQKFITVAEKYTQTQTALTQRTIYYPADLFKTVKWHDGSPFSVADVVMSIIMAFDRAKPDSPLYDEGYVPNYESFIATFKGVKIVSVDPLVIRTWNDFWALDAEDLAAAVSSTWFSWYDYGQAPWHTLVPGIMAETDKRLAFSADKSTALNVEWTSYIAGPSIDILNSYLVTATDSVYIPYAATMGEYVSADDATTRYANLTEWVRVHGHFWVGMGPFYLERAFPIEGTVLLKRNPNYPDMATKWDRFAEPKIATAEISGNESVSIGKEATFDVAITFKDTPYPMAEIEQVKYIVFDAKGQLAGTGAAEAVADGQWKVTLPADLTSKLEAGSNRLEIAVVSKVVGMPAFASMQFVTTP